MSKTRTTNYQEPAPRLRADARRNRDLLLHAARDLFVEQGPDAPLEEIARRAGVGIGTLYRRFPNRQALAHAVALDLFDRLAQEIRLALAEEAGAFSALARYMHRALDLRIGAIIPALIGEFSLEDSAINQARDRVARAIEVIIEAAQANGALRQDVAFGDIGLLIVRLSHPLPPPITPELDNQLAHRHLELLIDGLRGDADHPAADLSGPMLTLERLRAIPER